MATMPTENTVRSPATGSAMKAAPVRLAPGRTMKDQAFEVVCCAVQDGVIIGAEQFGRLLGWCGRVAGPLLLADAWDSGAIKFATLTAHVGPVWSAAEYPDAALGHARWRTLFRTAGFTRDGMPAELPDRPLELWRGSVPGRARDWSWSTDRAVAERYAGGGFRRPVGRLYRVVAPLAALLAACDGRDEAEFVLDTGVSGVEITEW